jgi:hypothetical protein
LEKLKEHSKFFLMFMLLLVIHGLMGNALNYRNYLYTVGFFSAKFIVSLFLTKDLTSLDYRAA